MTAYSPTSPRKRSDKTRERIREKALERGQERTADIHSRVLAAMATIEQEIMANNGVYPHKKGKVSGVEVARRAEVHPTTLFGDKYTELADTVRNWVSALKTQHAVTVTTVKRSLEVRISDWKALYNGLAQSHRDTELMLQQAEAELSQVREQLAVTSSERDALREQLKRVGASSIVSLRPRN